MPKKISPHSKKPLSKKNTFKRFLSALTELALQNRLLTLILFITFSVRILGLIPNEFHEDEPWVEQYSAQIFYNVVTKGDLTPYDYKYGSSFFYLNALPHFPVSFINYSKEVIQDILFPIDNNHQGIPSYQQYIKNIGPPLQRDIVIFWMQRAIAALFGGATIFVIYFIGKKLFNKQIALLSAFALSIMPLHVRESHYMVPDIHITFLISVCMLSMIYLFQSSKWKWYILTGLMIGFSSTLKYFPLPFLSYPFAVLLDKQKNKWYFKILTGLVFIGIGAFVGVPYLFLNHNAQLVFHKEMTSYVLLYYATPFTRYIESLGQFVASHGHTALPSFSTFIPTMFRPFYLSLLFFKGVGPITSILSLIGMILLLIRYPKKFLFLTIIPAFVLFYNSSYVPAMYERQADPMLPFLAIYIGIALYFLWIFLEKYNIKQRKAIFIVLLVISFYFPFTQSFASSLACGEKSVFDQSRDWIDNNIPSNTTVAFLPALPFPQQFSTEKNLVEMAGNRLFSLEEVKNKDALYSFINAYNVEYKALNSFVVDFFIPPQDLYANNFLALSLYEYKTRGTLLKKISKPDMCNQPTLIYYKLPPKLSDATTVIKDFSFNEIDDMKFWSLLQYSLPSKNTRIRFSKQEGMQNFGSLKYEWNGFSYTLPKVVSKKIKIKENNIYTFTGWIKSSQDLEESERDGLLRIDFYKHENDSTQLPGIVVALSPRTYGDSQWRKLTVTTKAPSNSSFMTASLQVNGSKQSGTFYFDDLEILGPKNNT